MNEITEIPPISELYNVVSGSHPYLESYNLRRDGLIYESESYGDSNIEVLPADNYDSGLTSPTDILSLDPPAFPTAVSSSDQAYCTTGHTGYFQDNQPSDEGAHVQNETVEAQFYVNSMPAPPPYPYCQRLPTVSPEELTTTANEERELYYYYTTNAFPVQELPPLNYGQRYSSTPPSPNTPQVFEISSQALPLSSDEDSGQDSCFDTVKKSSKKTRRRIPTVAQRKAANIRERRRMFNLNGAFDILRKTVPTFAYEKHLSRIETLRLAIGYVSFMKELLEIPVGEAHRKYANAPQEMSVKWSVHL